MRAHIIRDGDRAGEYEECRNPENCRKASACEHVEFHNRDHMDSCNGLIADVGAFAPNGMLPALFGGNTPMMVMDPLISPWDDGGEGVYPLQGYCRKFCRAADNLCSIILLYEDGNWVDIGIHEWYQGDARDALDMLWGNYDSDDAGTDGADGPLAAQNGSAVLLEDGWSLRMSAKAVKNRMGAPACGYDVFSNGRTVLSLESDPVHDASRAVIIARRHPNVALTVPAAADTLALTARMQDVGDAVDAIGEAADRRHGVDCSLSLDTADGSAVLLSKDADEPAIRRLTISGLASDLTAAADAIGMIGRLRV